MTRDIESPGLTAGLKPFVPYKDPDDARKEVEGDGYVIKAVASQFEPEKVLRVAAGEPFLKKVLTMFLSGDYDIDSLLNNPRLAGPTETELLRNIFDDVIRKDITLMKKYNNI